MKFKIKNCPECAWLSSPERLEPTEFCVLHTDKEDQPLGIIKAIKELKKERQKERIVDWIMFFFFAIFKTFFLIFGQGKSLIIIASIALTLSIICLLVVIYAIVDNEKETKKELQELQKKQSEWIIE